jgi:hypothetical protein
MYYFMVAAGRGVVCASKKLVIFLDLGCNSEDR